MPIVGDIVANRYRITAVLGVGGMASVYRATDLRLDREIAIKVLAANLAADPSLAARFDREARAMAGFSHPNVVSVYDVEPGDPAIGREPLYVMAYCPEGSLADRLAAEGRLAPSELIPIISDVATGLEELHRSGLVHRDVKPHNILFAGGRPKLADFGLAKSDAAHETSLTMPGSMLGTLPYLAPEIVAGDPGTAASDVYALGVSTFQGLTGRHPKTAGSLGEVADSVAATALLVSSVVPDLGTAYDGPVARALDADPGARPTPIEFAAELAAALAGTADAPIAGEPVPLAASPAGDLPSADSEAPTLIVAAAAIPTAPAVAADSGAAPTVVVPVAPLAPLAPLIAIGVIAIVLAIVVIGLMPRSSGGGTFPSFAPSATPAPSVASSVAPSAAQPAVEALDRVDASIEAAKGGKDGLSGRDANDLMQRSSSVRTALEHGNLDAARAAAASLADRARSVTKALDAARRDPLLAAIDALIGVL